MVCSTKWVWRVGTDPFEWGGHWGLYLHCIYKKMPEAKKNGAHLSNMYYGVFFYSSRGGEEMRLMIMAGEY